MIFDREKHSNLTCYRAPTPSRLKSDDAGAADEGPSHPLAGQKVTEIDAMANYERGNKTRKNDTRLWTTYKGTTRFMQVSRKATCCISMYNTNVSETPRLNVRVSTITSVTRYTLMRKFVEEPLAQRKKPETFVKTEPQVRITKPVSIRAINVAVPVLFRSRFTIVRFSSQSAPTSTASLQYKKAHPYEKLLPTITCSI